MTGLQEAACNSEISRMPSTVAASSAVITASLSAQAQAAGPSAQPSQPQQGHSAAGAQPAYAFPPAPAPTQPALGHPTALAAASNAATYGEAASLGRGGPSSVAPPSSFEFQVHRGGAASARPSTLGDNQSWDNRSFEFDQRGQAPYDDQYGDSGSEQSCTMR